MLLPPNSRGVNYHVDIAAIMVLQDRVKLCVRNPLVTRVCTKYVVLFGRKTKVPTIPTQSNKIYILFIVTSAQLRSRCDFWLAVKASLQTVHHVLHAASESGS